MNTQLIRKVMTALCEDLENRGLIHVAATHTLNNGELEWLTRALGVDFDSEPFEDFKALARYSDEAIGNSNMDVVHKIRALAIEEDVQW